MKFGTEIYQKMVSEWREAYLDYNTLKTLLKPFNILAKKYLKIPLPPTISNNPNSLTHFMITNYSQEDIDRLADFHEKFEHVMNFEIQKVTNFFKAKLLDYLRKLRFIKINITILQSINFEKDYAKLKGELRNCFHLFYKEIILLLDFYFINHEAARKILKKQKKLYAKLPKKLTPINLEDILDENSFLQKNIPKLHKLRQELENLYLDNFYHIHNKEVGKAELNKITHGRFTSHFENFLNGMFLGFATLLFVLMAIMVIQGRLDPDNDDNFNYVFHGYRGFALVLAYMWFLAWNVYGWTSYYVNYRNIFGFNYHYSTLSEIVKRNSIFTTILMLALLWYILIREDEDFANILGFFPKEYAPLVCWVFFLSYLFFPSFKYFNGEGRLYFFKLIKNLFLYSFLNVDFTMTWATEQFLSFVIPIRDVEFSFCYYIEKISVGDDSLYCSYTERLSMSLIITVLPLALRIVQCLRIMYQKHHSFAFGSDFFNALKYLTTMITVIFSFFYSMEQKSDLYFTLWVVFAILSTVYSYFWDLKMDWGFLESSSKHKYLRNQLSYAKPGFYYASIILNLFFRFCWILTLSPGIMAIFLRKQSFNFLFGVIEMVRRAIWNFFRVEMEHIANCGGFKVVEDYKLPFENFRYNTDENKVLYGEYDGFEVSPKFTKQPSQISSPHFKSMKSSKEKDLERPLLSGNSYEINSTNSINMRSHDNTSSFGEPLLYNKKMNLKYSQDMIHKEVENFKKSLLKNNCFIVTEDLDSSKDKDKSSQRGDTKQMFENSFEESKDKEKDKEKDKDKENEKDKQKDLINRTALNNYPSRLRNQQSVAYTRSISPEERKKTRSLSQQDDNDFKVIEKMGLETGGEKPSKFKSKVF